MSTQEIQEKINARFPILRDKYQVKKLGIFGSTVRGERGNDIDIIVEFSSPVGFFSFIRLEKFLSETLNKRVDLVTKKALKPAIRKQVLKEVIYV